MKGVQVAEQAVVLDCLERLRTERIDIVDADLPAGCRRRGIDEIYSYDAEFRRRGLRLLPIEKAARRA